MTVLTTERLILRAAQDGDLAPLFDVFSNPDAMKYWSNAPHISIDETRPTFEKLSRPGPRTYFVIEYQGKAVGTAGVHSGDEIGFILHPDHWRKGLMREAVEAIAHHIWKTTDFARITADADPDNTASVLFLTALGFRETGRAKNTFCINGVWSDSVYFALERPAK